MPAVLQLRATSSPDHSDPHAPIKAENIRLWLPSSLPPDLAANETLSGLREKEKRLRLAQMSDVLGDIRRIRRILAAVSEFQRMNVAGLGQRSMTRQQALYTRFKEKQTRAVQRYRDARLAMDKLDPSGGWAASYKPLLDSDLRGPCREDDEVILSEGRYEVSWIWLTPRTPSDSDNPSTRVSDAEFAETMRAEWARCRVRANRWDKERKLLLEEMRRVISYFEWKARWWRSQAARHPNASPRVQRGLAIYAEKQAAMFDRLAIRTASYWINFLSKLGPLPPWAEPYRPYARNVRHRRGMSGAVDLSTGGISDSSIESSSDSGDDSD